MAVLSRTRSGGAILSGGGADSLRRSSSSPSSAPSPFASAAAAARIASGSSGAGFFRRPVSPTRIHLLASPRPAPHPPRSVSVADRHRHHLNRPGGGGAVAGGDGSGAARRKTCMCSPTTHPGSFRCSLHKGYAAPHGGGGGGGGRGRGGSVSAQLNMRRSAMANSLVRIGTVEGEWVRRALTSLIRPSSHHLRRRATYQPRPSRLSTMSSAADADL